jgi:hypothetical protein
MGPQMNANERKCKTSSLFYRGYAWYTASSMTRGRIMTVFTQSRLFAFISGLSIPDVRSMVAETHMADDQEWIAHG